MKRALDHKEGWTPKNWCFQTVVLQKTLESLLDMKEIQPVHTKGNQSWIFTGRTEAEAEAPVLWPPDAKSWLICCKQPTHCITHPNWKHSVASLWGHLSLQDILQTNIFYSISKYKGCVSDRLAPVLSLRLHYPSCLGYPCFFLFKTFPTPTSRSDINSTPIKTRLVMTPFKELFTECVYHPSCLCCPPESWKQYVSQENISASGWWMLPRSLLNSTMEALRTYSCVRAK